jgi:hypothetical protein
MRAIFKASGLAAVFLMACGGPSFQGFDGGTDKDGSTTDDSGNTIEAGCPFCGVDASDGATPTCSPNPANYDIPQNNCDDDGDGTVDNSPTCDTGLQLTGPALDMAKAIGLCQKADATHWGIVSATYTNGYGSSTAPAALQTGILPKFGNVLKPRQGASFGVLSSGAAREYDQCNSNGPFKGGCSMQSGASVAPTGYPKDSPSCPTQNISNTVNDLADLKLQIKVPANAKGLAFDFDFGSGEWPEFVCTTYNDSFIAYLKSAAFNGGKPENISFDQNKNPVSVNNAFFDRCSPSTGLTSPQGYCTFPSKTYCAGGSTELQGTGFYDQGVYCGESGQDSGGGMTGWLTTSAPVQPGETITLEFMVWDTGDHIYDSSVLIDNWTWSPSDTSVSTGRPPN